MTESEIPPGLCYTREHHWVRVEDDAVTVGLTDHAQNELGDVVYVELPEVGTELHPSGEMGVVESVKTTTELYAPISGVVAEVNADLERSPDLINRDPYGEGWLVKLKMSDASEIEDMLTPEDYGHALEEGD